MDVETGDAGPQRPVEVTTADSGVTQVVLATTQVVLLTRIATLTPGVLTTMLELAASETE